jgi:hypothetical protein
MKGPHSTAECLAEFRCCDCDGPVEGDDWVNWSGLATLLEAVAPHLVAQIDDLLARSAPCDGASLARAAIDVDLGRSAWT